MKRDLRGFVGVAGDPEVIPPTPLPASGDQIVMEECGPGETGYRDYCVTMHDADNPNILLAAL